MGKKILVIIAARGGSKGIKNKNIRNLRGKPLIAHTILQAIRWGKADKIICSTDSEYIARIAKEYGAQIPFIRPKNLAGDKIGKIPVLRHALLHTERISKSRFDIIIDLDATAPVRRSVDIENALRIFRKSKAKSVFSVTHCRKNPYFNMVETGKNGFVHLVKQSKTPFARRQDAPVVYDMNASIYVYDRRYLLDERTTTAISNKSAISIMNKWSAFDIDEESDFQLIEFLCCKKGLVKL